MNIWRKYYDNILCYVGWRRKKQQPLVQGNSISIWLSLVCDQRIFCNQNCIFNNQKTRKFINCTFVSNRKLIKTIAISSKINFFFKPLVPGLKKSYTIRIFLNFWFQLIQLQRILGFKKVSLNKNCRSRI